MAKSSLRRAFAGLCLAGGLAALVSSAALAQAAAPAQPAPAAPTSPPLPPLTPSHLDVARKVLDASRVIPDVNALVSNVAIQMLAAYTQKYPDHANDFAQILGDMKPMMDGERNQLIAKATEIYARKMDEATLKQVLVFLQSPAGQQYIGSLPSALTEIADATQSWTKEVATLMGDHVVDEMKKRGVNMGP